MELVDKTFYIAVVKDGYFERGVYGPHICSIYISSPTKSTNNSNDPL